MNLIIGILCIFVQFSSSAHIHSKHRDSKERIELGRDAGHYDKDGAHHREFDHEAILGSVKEASKFDQLPVEESKRRLRLLLTKMDLNKDEFIERHELKSWILRSFKLLSDEESTDRLEDADTNTDGRVSWDEIVDETYGSDPEDLALEEDAIADDKLMFSVADLNKDGYLDKAEFKAFTHPEEDPRMHDVLVKQTIKNHDKNLDLKIDFDEFLSDRNDGGSEEWYITERETFDHVYDKNKDGFLDYTEIPAWIIHHDERIAEEEVNHLFTTSDDDHDDRLSFDEVIEHHDIFVGSEATDYGDHLHDIDRFMDEL